MKIYKYRDLNPVEALPRIETIVRERTFWCARPDTLNDPKEFAWTCDYALSAHTAELLAELLMVTKGRSASLARLLVAKALEHDGVKPYAEPVIDWIIRKCRDEIGLACFGSSPDNDTLWERYGGGGVGVCIEVEAPDGLFGWQIHRVQYWDEKVMHIDTLLRSRLEIGQQHLAKFYELSLLSKPLFWKPEQEIRFVSKRQKVNVVIDGSAITRIVVGDRVSRDVRKRIEKIASGIPTEDRR